MSSTSPKHYIVIFNITVVLFILGSHGNSAVEFWVIDRSPCHPVNLENHDDYDDSDDDDDDDDDDGDGDDDDDDDDGNEFYDEHEYEYNDFATHSTMNMIMTIIMRMIMMILPPSQPG